MKNDYLITKTKSFCPKCLNVLDSDIIGRGGKTIISRKCEKHGKLETLHLWDDVDFYMGIRKIFSRYKTPLNPFVLLMLTNRCNQCCPFCFSNSRNDKSPDPSDEDLEKNISMIENSTIILYGGEPTLRKNLVEIIAKVSKSGNRNTLATNGLLLENRKFLKKLKKAGIGQIQFQLDSLREDRSKSMQRVDVTVNKIKAIENITKEGIPISLFVLLVKDKNESEVRELVSFAVKNPMIRSIYLTSLAYNGRTRKGWKKLQTSEIFASLEESFDITKDDFLKCMELENNIFELVYRLTGSRFETISTCDSVCHVVNNKKIIPMTKVIDYNKINDFLSDMLENPDKGKMWLVKRFIKLIKSKPFKNIRNLPLILVFISNSFLDILSKKKMTNSSDKITRINVTNFLDRFNATFEQFEKCNLKIRFGDGSLNSYCKGLILDKINT